MSVLKGALLSFLLLVGCSPWNEPKQVTIMFPVPEESVEDVMSYFQSLDPRNEVTAKFVPFNVQIESHPRIAGYVELTSDAEVDGVGHTTESLTSYVNGLKSRKVLPVVNTYWDRDGNEFRWLAKQVNKNEKNGVKHQYIVLEDNELHLIW